MKIPPVAADLFRAVAPVLGTALGGPLGGTVAAVAVKVLDQWVVPRGPGGPTPEDVVAAVEKNAGNPALALDLKRAELAVKDYELRMKRIDARFDLLKLEQLDRADARALSRDSGMARTTFIAGMALVGTAMLMLFGVVAGCVAALTGRLSIAPENAQIAIAAFGLIGTVVGVFQGLSVQVVGFYFGSSASSKEKTEQLGGALSDLGAALADKAQAPPVVVPPAAPPVIVHAPPAAPQPSQDGTWHQGPHGGRRWRLTPGGVVPEGQTEPMRTVGQPVTVRRIWRDFGPLIEEACARDGVPLELAAATIATESRGVADAGRTEPDGRQSVGLMQLLVGTASDVAGREVTAASLLDPANNIGLGVRYIARQRPATGYQPPLVAAAYNAGGLYPPREQDANPWRLRSTGDHIDRFCQFYGDACAVAAEDGWGKAG